MRAEALRELLLQLIEINRRIEMKEIRETDLVLQRRVSIASLPETHVIDRGAVQREKDDFRISVLPVWRADGFGEGSVDLDPTFDPELSPPFVNDEEVSADGVCRAHSRRVAEVQQVSRSTARSRRALP